MKKTLDDRGDDMKAKERPILFSSPMVRAILDGRKTQTRRVMKPQPPAATVEMRLHGDGWLPCWDVAHGDIGDRRRCPHGHSGDRLWVRETWCPYPEESTGRIWYRATDERSHDRWRDNSARPHLYNWRPSIHMPRWASRITLRVVSVRAERLQDINETDARAEGAPAIAADDARTVPTDILARLRDLHTPSYMLGFASIWMDIYGPGSWYTNPWVWVIEFKRLEA